MKEDDERYRQISKWVIATAAMCCLIFLGIRYVGTIAASIKWVVGLVKPLIIGFILALMLNVPMSFVERRLLKKSKLQKGKRPLSILLALILVMGIFIGVAFLVVPELVEAVKMIITIITGGIDQLVAMENSLPEDALGGYLGRWNIDWLGLKEQLNGWLKEQGDVFVNQAVGAAGSFLSTVVTAVISLTFSIYILANKETLKRQITRLMRVWLPAKLMEPAIHIASVCSDTFKRFVAGQATEAIILGTLCMIGMAILQIPYAPMIGALVGVTALIPVVGAWVGAIVGTVMILTVAPFKAVVFLIFLLTLQQVEGNAIYPRVVGSKINLPSIWVLAAVTVGGKLGGPIGMLLGVPAASAAYALLKEATQYREERKNAKVS